MGFHVLSGYKLKCIQSPGQPSSSFCVLFRKPPPTIYTMPYAEYHAGAGTPSNRGFKGNENECWGNVWHWPNFICLFTSGRTVMLDNLSEGKRGRIRVSVIPTFWIPLILCCRQARDACLMRLWIARPTRERSGFSTVPCWCRAVLAQI